MDANSSSTIVIDVNAPNVVGVVSNTAQVTINDQDPDTSNNSSGVSVNVTESGQNSSVDLSIVKTASNKAVTSGEQFSWNLDVTNNGPDTASNVKVNDQLPSGFEFISASMNGTDVCKVNGSDLVCIIGKMSNSATNTITVLGTATLASGQLENTATVSSTTNETDAKNNSDSASIIVNLSLIHI